MCTAIFCKGNSSYFGRNLDLERGYGESVVISPRNFSFCFRHKEALLSHYAMVGMATVINDFPLYFDATNEKGLSMAGLNFPENACYYDFCPQKDNIAPFEFIPFVLGLCKCVDEAKELIKSINLTNTNFCEALPLSPLHWLISDKEKSVVVEPLKSGLKIYDNPFNLLTNNPPFCYHSINLSNYMGLHTGLAKNTFNKALPLNNYSLGMGALGLPGDFSSASRFVRAFFVKENSAFGADKYSNVNQFFHILNSVAMPKGCVWTKNGFEYTRYSSCCDLNAGIYHYTTYNNLEIRSVCMYDVNLESNNLFTFEVCGLE